MFETADILFDFIVVFAMVSAPLAIGVLVVELIESAKRRRAK